MSTNPLHPYLPKLKEGTDDAVMVPHELRKWDDRQAKTRLGHLANAIEVPSGVESVHSIPDPWARMILFASALREEDHVLHRKVRGEWRGLLAILGLKEVLRFGELSARPLNLDLNRTEPGSFFHAVARVLPGKQGAISPKATWACFHLLLWSGDNQRANSVPRAFGLTSPWTLVATGSSYTSVLTSKEVPWFVGGLLEDPCKHLSARERTALAEWLLLVRQNLAATGKGPRHADIARCLDQFIDDLDKAATLKPESQVFSENKLGLDGSEFFSILNRPRKPDTSVITDVLIVTDRPDAPQLVLIEPSLAAKLNKPEREITIHGNITLATAERHLPDFQHEKTGKCAQHGPGPALSWCTAEYFFQDDLIYEQNLVGSGFGGEEEDAFPGCRRVSAEGRTAGRHIALPLTEEAARLFTPAYLEKNFSIQWLDAGGAVCRLKLSVQRLANSPNPNGEPGAEGAPVEVVIERAYGEKDMNRVQNLPAVCIWPNFRFDDEPDPKNPAADGTPGVKNRWKRYYLFQSWRGGKKEEFVVTPVAGHAADARLLEEQGEHFQITTTSRFPEVLVCRMPFSGRKPRPDDGSPPKGLLLLREPERPLMLHGRSAALGIDFGTTGTSIFRAFGVNEEDAGQAESIDRVTFQDRLFRVAVGDKGEFPRVTRDFFLPGKDWSGGKILSVFQDFGAADTRVAVRDGHVLFAQDSGSHSFVTGNQESIKTNLKWGADRRENFSARDFLTQLCLQSLAELIAAGATSVDIRYSYPTAFTDPDLQYFDGVWRMVIQEARRATDVPLTNLLRGAHNCEAVAATRFFAHSENATRLNVFRGALTLDIGGGTTDIAVWNRDPERQTPALLAHLSVLFAGKDIFLTPLRLRPALLKQMDESKEMGGALSALNNLKKGGNAYHAQVDAIVSKYGNGLLEKLPAVALEPEIQEFLKILELGLCGIGFYSGLLVGRLVQAGMYDPTQARVPVFIGGNGSKLVSWCALGEPRRDSIIVRKFARCLLAAANLASADKLAGKTVEVSLSTRPKEEVAFGLVVKDNPLARNDDFIQPLPGENYLIGSQSRREARDWSIAPEVETLRTQPVIVDPSLPVFSRFLEAMEIHLSEDERYPIADAIDRELGRMAVAAQQLPPGAEGASRQDAIRREPMFIIALKHLIADRINKLVKHG